MRWRIKSTKHVFELKATEGMIRTGGGEALCMLRPVPPPPRATTVGVVSRAALGRTSEGFRAAMLESGTGPEAVQDAQWATDWRSVRRTPLLLISGGFNFGHAARATYLHTLCIVHTATKHLLIQLTTGYPLPKVSAQSSL